MEMRPEVVDRFESNVAAKREVVIMTSVMFNSRREFLTAVATNTELAALALVENTFVVY
jgi:hypothetical protein